LKRNKTKRAIYIRTFSALFAMYLVLMAGFSIFLILQEKKVMGMELQAHAFHVNNTIEEILQNNMDLDHHITNIAKIKKELVGKSPFVLNHHTEIALYTGTYDLIFHTNDYWLCSYTEYSIGDTQYTGYAYLNPKDWFDEKEVNELQNYFYAQPKAEKPGDLTEYSLDIDGFWLDNEMIIPDKIYVTPMHAVSFDETGNVTSSSGTRPKDMVYRSGYQNTRGLPYFEFAGIQPVMNDYSNDQTQIELRNMVLNKEKLKEAAKQPGRISYERVNPVTYRYYLTMPYQNTIDVTDDQKPYSASWTVVAREIHLLDQCTGTLTFVWVSCFITFLTAALILSVQTYKTYKEREELERHRKETTNALAHDLKTPLSIISGYAQNLIENIHTEKRGYYAAHIQSNVKRMDKIIRQMLDLSRLETDQFQMNFENVSLSKVSADLINRYSLVCDEKSIAVRLEGEAVIKADYSFMERVIDNFFINALDHTPVGGSISIRITDSLLEFYNSGSHIPEEKIKEIWEPYKKADESRGNTKGTGLGLSIAGTILKLYHFSYGVDNKDDGVVFWFQFA